MLKVEDDLFGSCHMRGNVAGVMQDLLQTTRGQALMRALPLNPTIQHLGSTPSIPFMRLVRSRRLQLVRVPCS